MEDNIEVAIRVRPLLDKELNERLPIHWQINGQNIFQIDEQGKQSSQAFRFDHIFGGEKTNNEIFQDVVQPMVRSGMEGYNATVFAYGQTASGKTYTMLGCNNDQGIIPLTIEDIFESINNNLERKFLLRLSYIEIYNDILYDLLDATPKTIKIHEDLSGAIHLNVEEKIIHTAEQAHAIFKEGDKLRRYGATNANQRSSRSHTIFRIIIESTPLNDDPDSDLPVQVSHLNLVDLAGSERVSQTKATGARLREGGQINKSLYLLSLVIRQLSEGKPFTNFRDSKLTRLLKESLGGNAKTLIIGAITPTSIEDSQSTLTFTYQAKKIKNKPTINEVLDSEALTKQYIQKEKELRRQLEQMAKDKKELEEKHVRTVSELTDKLCYFGQQFITSSSRTLVKDEGNRRHTMCSSTIQKTVKHFEYSFKCATQQRNSKVRRRPVSQLQINVPSTSSSQDNFVGTFSSLQKNVLRTSNYYQESERVEERCKYLPDLIEVDNSESQDKEDRKSILVEGTPKISHGFGTLQTQVKDLESQTFMDSDQAAYCGNDQNELLGSGKTISLDDLEDDTKMGNQVTESEGRKTCIAGAPSVMEEEEPYTSGVIEAIALLPNKTEKTDIEQPKSYENGQFDDFKFKELLEENELLKEQINSLNQKLKTAQQSYAALEIKLEDTSKVLEKTEDDLLSANEQLDHEENEKNKLQQTITGMMSKIASKINELNDNYVVLHLKNVFDDIIKSNENLNEYLGLTKKEQLAEITLEYVAVTEDLKHVHQQEGSEEQDLLTENKYQFVQSEVLLLENGSQEPTSIVDLLHDLKVLLCSDDDAITLSEEQDKNLAAIQSRFDENDKQNSFQKRCEELQNEMRELEQLFNDQYKANLEKDQEISERDRTVTEKDTLIANLKCQVEHISSSLELSQMFREKRQIFDRQLIEKEEDINNLIIDKDRLATKIVELEDIHNQLIKQLFATETSIGNKTKAINKLMDEKHVLEIKLTEQEQVNEKLIEEDNKLQGKLTQKEQLNVKLSEENHILQDKLVQQVQLNAKLTNEKHLLEDDIIKLVPAKVKLTEENNILQDMLTELAEKKQMVENTNAKLTKENDVLQNKLTQQEQLNVKLAAEKHLLEKNITKQVQEDTKLLKDKIAEQKHLITKYIEETSLHEAFVTKQSQVRAKLIEEINNLKATLALQVELNAKIAKEKQMLQDSVTRGEDTNAKLQAELTKEKHIIDNKLVEQQQLNNELIKQKRLLEEKIVKCLMHENEMIKLTKENGTLQEKLIQREKLNADLKKDKHLLEYGITKQEFTNTKLTEENKILQNKLTQQEQLNIKFDAEKHLLEERITKQEQEISKFVKDTATLQNTISQQTFLITKYTKEISVLETFIIKQSQESAKWIEKGKILQAKLTPQVEVNAKTVVEDQVLCDNVTRDKDANTKPSGDLNKEEDILHNKLAQQQQLNMELLRQYNSLLEDKTAKYLKQEKKLVNLAEENSVLQNKLAEQKQLNAKFVKEKDLLKLHVVKRKQSNIELTDRITILQKQITEKETIISQYGDKDKVFVSIKPQTKIELIYPEDQKFSERLVKENKMLQDKNTEQEKVIDELMKEVNLFLKQSAQLASLTEKFKILTTSIAEDFTRNWNGAVCTEDTNDILNSDDCKYEWQLHIKQLYYILKTKNAEIEDLDNEIINIAKHVKYLDEIIKDQTKQISKLKDQQMAKLKTQEVSVTKLKKRRSIAQDLSRNLNEDEEISLCPSCKVTNLMALNNALLRESHRKFVEIAKLEETVRNLRLNCDDPDHKNLNEKHEKLEIKYKQLKEVAVMRRHQLKKFEIPKVDCETQTAFI